MNLTSSGFGRLLAIQTLFAQFENATTDSLQRLFKDCFSHESRIDMALSKKIVAGVSENRAQIEALFSQHSQADSTPLFRCFAYAMIFEVRWMEKPMALVLSEYKKVGTFFFPDAVLNALKAILNQLK